MRRKADCSNVGISKALDIIFGTEIWSLLFSLLTQDTPFFIMRFFILVNYESTSKNYTLYFFVIKNFALCLFEIYRIIILFSRTNKKKRFNSNLNYENTFIFKNLNIDASGKQNLIIKIN